jgi:hypothetical protein
MIATIVTEKFPNAPKVFDYCGALDEIFTIRVLSSPTVGLGRSEIAEGKPDVALRQLRYIERYIVRRLPGPAFPDGDAQAP